jgi:hypothetical protein
VLFAEANVHECVRIKREAKVDGRRAEDRGFVGLGFTERYVDGAVERDVVVYKKHTRDLRYGDGSQGWWDGEQNSSLTLGSWAPGEDRVSRKRVY